jgi:hypothetical protein
MRPNKIYIYLESARRDLQNDEIYQMSRFAKLKNLTKIFTPFCNSRRVGSKYISEERAQSEIERCHFFPSK